METGAIVAVPAFVAGLAFVIWQAFRRRKERAERVAYVTKHGVTVLKSESGAAPPQGLVEDAIDEAVGFWSKWSRSPAAHAEAKGLIRSKLRTVRLGFTNEPKVKYAGKTIDARGITSSGGSAVLVSLAYDVATDYSLIVHEFGHVCLFALGVPDATGEEHHKTMTAAGWGY